MVAGIALRKLAGAIHAYPTQAQAIKKAADALQPDTPVSGAWLVVAQIAEPMALRVKAEQCKPQTYHVLFGITQKKSGC